VFAEILACCRGSARAEVFSGCNPIELAELATHHGVLPIVYEAVSAGGAASAVRNVASDRFQAHVRKTLWLTRELGRVVEHLSGNRIPVLPYKGPVLAEMLYGDVARREYSDLDFLVQKSDVPRLKSVLKELGYQPGISLTPREERDYLLSGYEYTFDSSNGRNLIEIQWQIVPRFYSVDFDMRAFFERSIPILVAGHSMVTLCPEDLLLVLCVHAAKHAWAQLGWLCDIEALSRRTLNWKWIAEQANSLGIQRILQITFFLEQELLGDSVGASHFPADEASTDLARGILQERMERGEEYDIESVDYFRLMMSIRERASDRRKFLWRLASTPGPGEWSAVHLPEPLFPLYRGVRAARLLRRFLS
jgi:hypothetical protein